VEVGDAVDLVRADDAEVGHSDLFGRGFLDQGEHAQFVVVSRVLLADLVEPEVVDQVDQLEVPGQQLAYQLHAPLLQRLRQDCVVRVGKDLIDDLPGLFLVDVLLIHQDPQEFNDSQGGVRVVELYAGLFWEVLPGEGLSGFFGMRLVPPDDILDGGRDKQVLLLESKLLSGVGGVVGVKDAGDVLGPLPGLEGVVVFSPVEGEEVELVEGQRFPEAQADGVEGGVAGDGRVVGARDDGLAVLPVAALDALGVGRPADLAVKLDLVLHVHALDLPRVAVAEPVVRHLHLVAVLDQLLEDAVVVANPVPPGRIVQRRQGVQKACGESAEASVSERCVYLFFIDAFQVVAEVFEGLLVLVFEVEVDERVLQAPSNQKLQREVIDLFGARPVEGPVGVVEALNQPVSHRVRDRLVAVGLLEVEPGPGEGVFHVVHDPE